MRIWHFLSIVMSQGLSCYLLRCSRLGSLCALLRHLRSRKTCSFGKASPRRLHCDPCRYTKNPLRSVPMLHRFFLLGRRIKKMDNQERIATSSWLLGEFTHENAVHGRRSNGLPSRPSVKIVRRGLLKCRSTLSSCPKICAS
ncbi:hypothetical protein DFH06DRAFT_1177180 [Mycena polygramma]|nr:hypothetical protein DFH06DRAFT_1177180 [Mycena polygramma]